MPKSTPAKQRLNKARDRSGKVAAKRLAILEVYDREIATGGTIQTTADSLGIAWRTVRAAVRWREEQQKE